MNNLDGAIKEFWGVEASLFSNIGLRKSRSKSNLTTVKSRVLTRATNSKKNFKRS